MVSSSVVSNAPRNPYIVRIGIKNTGSDYDLVRIVENEFLEAVRAHTLDLNTMYECWDAYMALNGSQWDRKKLSKLKNEGRDALTFDIIGPKTDTLTGALISELPDMDWTPIEGQRTSGTEAIRDSWYIDKELTNSDYELMLAIRDGLVHIGWIQLVETKKYGKPVIGLKRIMPGFFIPSAYWIQESDRDMTSCFKIGYLTPDQLKFKYKAREYEIDEAIKIIRRQGYEELPSNSGDMRRRYVGRIADHYKVIEKHWLDFVETSRLVGAKIEKDPITGIPTGQVRWVPFPVTKDRATLEHFAAVNEIEWETVEETPYEDVIHMVTTIVPELNRSIVLENAKSKIQPKGLPFYHFTTLRFNGRNKGVVAAMLDPQRTIDERETLVTELISKANGGSDIIDENIFKDDKDREKLVKNSNKPGYKHFADLSQSKSGNPVIKIGANQYPAQVLDQIGRMYDKVIPLASRVSDSMSAITQSGKSGILFEREIQINRIGNLLMDKGVKRLMDDMAEGYFFQWQISYEGVEREITSRDGKRKIHLNQRFLQNGKEMIRNAVGYVPRCRALVTESTRSPTYQMRYRMIYSEMLQNIDPNVNPEHFNYIFNKLMSTLDLPEKDKAELESLNKMMMVRIKMMFVRDIVSIHSETKQASLASASADMQLRQLLMEMQQMGLGGPDQAVPAVPEQVTDATYDVIQPAGPVNEPPRAVGSDVVEVQ